MSDHVNGHRLGGGPLHLSGPQRAALLAKLGLSQGWVLMSVAEMYDMKKAMDGATKENERLNQQTANLLAKWLRDKATATKALDDARTALKLIAGAENEHVYATYRIDALNAVDKLNAALKEFDAMTNDSEPQKPNEDQR